MRSLRLKPKRIPVVVIEQKKICRICRTTRGDTQDACIARLANVLRGVLGSTIENVLESPGAISEQDPISSRCFGLGFGPM